MLTWASLKYPPTSTAGLPCWASGSTSMWLASDHCPPLLISTGCLRLPGSEVLHIHVELIYLSELCLGSHRDLGKVLKKDIFIWQAVNDKQEYTTSNEMTQLLIVLPLDMFDCSPLSHFQLLCLLEMRDSSRVIKWIKLTMVSFSSLSGLVSETMMLLSGSAIIEIGPAAGLDPTEVTL